MKSHNRHIRLGLAALLAVGMTAHAQYLHHAGDALAFSAEHKGPAPGRHDNDFTGSFAGNGGGLTNVDALTLDGLGAQSFWQLDGNNVTVGQFIGSVNEQPVEFWANGSRALRLEPGVSGDGAPNVIGGSPVNFVASGVAGATVAGGGAASFYLPGYGVFAYTNSVSGSFGTVAGGARNAAIDLWDTVCGGVENTANGIGGGAATVAGGQGNNASAQYSTVCGGIINFAVGKGSFIGGGGYDGTYAGNHAQGFGATIGGGTGNGIGSFGIDGFIGGGYGNTNNGRCASVPGGYLNVADGDYSFAAGYGAQANNAGAFVWSDAAGTPTTSFTDNQFMVRASGGVVFLNSTQPCPTSYAGAGPGVALQPSASSWSTVSDKNAKKNVVPVDGESILAKLSRVPIEKWNYKWEKDSDVPNIGPMAQDFIGAFYPGRDDKSISTLEFDGVELAAIQGLNQKLKEKDAEIRDLRRRLEKVEQLLSEKRRGDGTSPFTDPNWTNYPSRFYRVRSP